MSKLANIMIGFVLFSLIILGVQNFSDGFKSEYDITSESNWSGQFLYLNEMEDISKEMTDILEDENSNWLEQGIKLGMSMLRNVLNLPKYVYKLFGSLPEILNVPAWAVNYLGIILIIILIMIIGSALLRWYL